MRFPRMHIGDWNNRATNEKVFVATKAIFVLGFAAAALWIIYDWMEGDDLDDDDRLADE